MLHAQLSEVDELEGPVTFRHVNVNVNVYLIKAWYSKLHKVPWQNTGQSNLVRVDLYLKINKRGKD